MTVTWDPRTGGYAIRLRHTKSDPYNAGSTINLLRLPLPKDVGWPVRPCLRTWSSVVPSPVHFFFLNSVPTMALGSSPYTSGTQVH